MQIDCILYGMFCSGNILCNLEQIKIMLCIYMYQPTIQSKIVFFLKVEYFLTRFYGLSGLMMVYEKTDWTFKIKIPFDF